MPSRYFEGNARPEHHSNVEDFYCQIYCETVDTAANYIVEHFNQKDYTMYANCEQVLLKGTLGELVSQNVDQLCKFYAEFDSDTLQIKRFVLAEPYLSFRQGEDVGDTLHNVVFLKKNKNIWSLIPIIPVMPATNASSECVFSAMRRVMSYLHTTISNNRLNHLMMCTVHKELVKELNHKQVTNDFGDRVERHSSIFGHFST